MRYILLLLLGVVVGAALVYFLLVGPARATQLPGTALRAPEPGGDPPGTVVLSLDEKFFGALLGTIFSELGSPTFQLSSVEGGSRTTAEGVRYVAAQGCQNQLAVVAEGSGVQTGVRLADGQIVAPLAFNGTYNLLGNCTNFRGWAQANIQLSFQQQEQSLYGRINVESVNVEGVPPVLSGVVTQFVQNAINQRVNPLTIMGGEQLQLAVPVEATGGMLRAQAQDVRSEIKDGALRLHITYDFNGTRGQQASPPPQS